ncbi:MAG: MBL fold metallo-hydrolase [Bacillota bacterium]
MEYRQYILEELKVNCYLVWSGAEAGVIDPGGPVEELVRFLSEKQLHLQWVVNTHGHIDHIAGNEEFIRKFQVPLLIHQRDRLMLTSATANLSAFFGEELISPDADRILTDGEELKLGTESLTVIETPGHTPGGISLYTKGLLFSGDTLFLESIGRTDFPGSDHFQLISSIRERLFTLPPETVVLPGHGGATTIAHEMKYNPFITGDHEF